jgi:U3 small nucleolar RNA-associated protein 3
MYGDDNDDDGNDDDEDGNNDDYNNDDDYYDNDDDEYGFNALLSSGPDMKKRRKAPDEDMNANDDDDDLVAAFGKKKKEFNMMKKAHYTAEPRYGGIDDSVEVGQKRAASYQIMKNRGLTPHRKKANRNPRVKKRQQYNKAVIRRKGAVRDIITGVNNYGGESTGIKANLSRSRKL